MLFTLLGVKHLLLGSHQASRAFLSLFPGCWSLHTGAGNIYQIPCRNGRLPIFCSKEWVVYSCIRCINRGGAPFHLYWSWRIAAYNLLSSTRGSYLMSVCLATNLSHKPLMHNQNDVLFKIQCFCLMMELIWGGVLWNCWKSIRDRYENLCFMPFSTIATMRQCNHMSNVKTKPKLWTRASLFFHRQDDCDFVQDSTECKIMQWLQWTKLKVTFLYETIWLKKLYIFFWIWGYYVRYTKTFICER